MRTLILLFIAALALARPETQAALIDGSAPGQVDLSFDLGSAHGPNGTVRALTVRPDGYILVGGYFTSIARMRKFFTSLAHRQLKIIQTGRGKRCLNYLIND